MQIYAKYIHSYSLLTPELRSEFNNLAKSTSTNQVISKESIWRVGGTVTGAYSRLAREAVQVHLL